LTPDQQQHARIAPAPVDSRNQLPTLMVSLFCAYAPGSVMRGVSVVPMAAAVVRSSRRRVDSVVLSFISFGHNVSL